MIVEGVFHCLIVLVYHIVGKNSKFECVCVCVCVCVSDLSVGDEQWCGRDSPRDCQQRAHHLRQHARPIRVSSQVSEPNELQFSELLNWIFLY